MGISILEIRIVTLVRKTVPRKAGSWFACARGGICRYGCSKTESLLLDDVDCGSVCESAGATVAASVGCPVERNSIRPHHCLQIILRILTAGGKWIPIQAIASAHYRFGSELPGDAHAGTPIVFDRRRSEEILSRQHHMISEGIGQEALWRAWYRRIGNARRLVAWFWLR